MKTDSPIKKVNTEPTPKNCESEPKKLKKTEVSPKTTNKTNPQKQPINDFYYSSNAVLQKKIVPSDNSCLFASIYYLVHCKYVYL